MLAEGHNSFMAKSPIKELERASRFKIKEVALDRCRSQELYRCQTGKAQEFELLVSSTVFSLASKVFNAMFSDRFAEGNALRANSAAGKTTSIPLPEDDPVAMMHLCRILHHQSDSSETIPIAELCDLAMLYMKYDLLKLMVLQHACEIWLTNLIPSLSDTTQLPKALIVAFIFEHRGLFSKLASTLVLGPKDRYQASEFAIGDDVELPARFFSE